MRRFCSRGAPTSPWSLRNLIPAPSPDESEPAQSYREVVTVNRLALFVDRREAGRRLASALERFRDAEPVVVALPRGGVPVGFEIARALNAPLDITCVRKLGAPMQPEYGIGAVAEEGVKVLREGIVDLLDIGDRELEEIIARESAELERRCRLYRASRTRVPVAGTTVVLVDDGVATGSTAIAGARSVRARGAAHVVLAVPLAAPGAEQRLGESFDDVVSLYEPEEFPGVGAFYADFRQVTDDEVIRLLGAAAGKPGAVAALADPPAVATRSAEIEVAPDVRLRGDLRIPETASGLVIFAHGSGSSRSSPRNRQVAAALNDSGLATLLFDLLTEEEAGYRELVFDVDLLAARLIAVTGWARNDPSLAHLPIGYFGASTGAAAAMVSAAELGKQVAAVVSRGGRPDLAGRLDAVTSPTLLIVGGIDWGVLELNRHATEHLRCEVELAIVPGATHLFTEPGALERVAGLAVAWFWRHLRPSTSAREPSAGVTSAEVSG